MQVTKRIVVTGASGLVGRALAAARPIAPIGREPRDGGLWWEPQRGVVHDDGEPIGAVVHLAGASLAQGRWTASRRQEIEQSRIRSTHTLVNWLSERSQRPAVLVCASAVGFYGDRGEHVLDESTSAGEGFLAELCQRWEEEAQRAEALRIRVVRTRLSVVLSREGGALRKMLPLFRIGLGGPLGSGKQWFPWIHVADALRAIECAIDRESWGGAYNLVAPGAARQGEFAQQLGRALHRPAHLPAPSFALRAALGAMADEALLASQRVRPIRLLAEGFEFQYPDLESALRELCSKEH